MGSGTSGWLTIVSVLLGLGVLAAWFTVYRWSERGDAEGIPRTRAALVAKTAVNVAFAARIVVVIALGRSDEVAAVSAQWVATAVFVGSIAVWAWLERQRRARTA